MLAEAFRAVRDSRVMRTLGEYRELRNQGMEPALPLPTLNDFRVIGQIHRLRTANLTRMQLRGEQVSLADPYTHISVEAGDREVEALWQQVRSPIAMVALEFVRVPLYGLKEKFMESVARGFGPVSDKGF